MENDRGGKDTARSYRTRYPLSPVCVERISGNAVRVSAKWNRQYGTGDGNACRKQTSDRAHGQLCRNNAEVKLSGTGISAGQLETDIRAELAILEKEYDRQSVLQIPASNESFFGDREIILEVTENLLSNAFRYGKRQVVIMVRTGYSELSVCVRDDGEGFKENAEKITEAFHGQNVKDSLKHAGIGMYISRLYCEKHGGKLVLENDEQGGALVTAIFRRLA